MKRLLPALLLLAACGGKPAPTTTPVDNGGGDVEKPAPPPYLPMFDKGRVWTFEVKFLDSYWDDQDPNADADGNVRNEVTADATCTVTEAGEADGVKSSHIECDALNSDSVSGESLTGDWEADATGLYKVEGDQRTLVMPAVPAEKSETSKDNPDDPEQETGFLSIKKQGDDWCWESSFAWGDESWSGLCFGEGGVTGGDFGWAGGSSHEATFSLKEGK